MPPLYYFGGRNGTLPKTILSPQLPITITREDTSGGYQHKTSKQLTPPSPADEIEYFLGKSDNGYYIYYSCFNSEKLFLYDENGVLKEIIDLEQYLKNHNFKISGNYADPGMYFILYGSKVIVKVTGKNTILFLSVNLEKVK